MLSPEGGGPSPIRVLFGGMLGSSRSCGHLEDRSSDWLESISSEGWGLVSCVSERTGGADKRESQGEQNSFFCLVTFNMFFQNVFPTFMSKWFYNESHLFPFSSLQSRSVAFNR